MSWWAKVGGNEAHVRIAILAVLAVRGTRALRVESVGRELFQSWFNLWYGIKQCGLRVAQNRGLAERTVVVFFKPGVNAAHMELVLLRTEIIADQTSATGTRQIVPRQKIALLTSQGSVRSSSPRLKSSRQIAHVSF